MKLSHFHITLPKTGEVVSGDTVVARAEDGAALLVVLDALGHGPIAAEVARRGRAFLQEVPLSKSVLAITEGLHDALRGTRGAAAMCCVLRADRIEGCGVGNVELRVVAHDGGSRGRSSRLVAPRVPVILTPGILGVSLKSTRVFEGALTPGARLLLFSDGVSPRMEFDRFEKLSAEHACRSMMDRYRRAHDDATLLIADVEALAP